MLVHGLAASAPPPPSAPGVAPTPGNANAVNVDTGAPPASFHLQVIC